MTKFNNKKEKKPVRKENLTRFKSKWEEKVWYWLPRKNSSYEADALLYSLTKRYIPDFKVQRPDGSFIYLEAKGYLRSSDRSKMKAVVRDNPEIDIRFVFAKDNKLSSRTNTRYSEWAEKNGFKYCVGKPPHHWFYPQEQDLEYRKTYYQKNKEHIKDRTKWANKLNRYGISKEKFFQMKEEQDNKCAICSCDFESLPREPDIDHCHETKVVRGLLCFQCNGGLGQFDDDVNLLKKAIEYLEKVISK